MKANKLVKYFILFFAVAMAFVISCSEETTNETVVSTNVTAEPEQPMQQVTDGLVFSTTNEPIPGVTISVGGQTIGETREDGTFDPRVLLELNEGDVVTFSHPEFVPVIRVVRANPQITIVMRRRAQPVIVNAREGGVVRLGRQGQIEVPPNAFALQGKPFGGDVEIRATFINVADRTEIRSAPGAFISEEQGADRLVPLQSFGLAEVTVTTRGENQPLDLIRGQSLRVTLPIVTETPRNVGLYVLNPETGLWSLVGELTNTGSVLQGDITDTNRTWNADRPCGQSLVCVRVRIDYGGANLGCGIAATGLSYRGFDGVFQPDANGFVELQVCPDSVFELGACFRQCCGPGVPPTDPCCRNPELRRVIDMSTITLNPNGCTDIGVWLINN
ncbi:hypothetical protein [Ascidiimonas aurantiaca]|uniref:hypothetical protein n=1 Tax=Ascidiimonas aurantiaca TaxID=1685432 RepID=UPI0030EF2966